MRGDILCSSEAPCRTQLSGPPSREQVVNQTDTRVDQNFEICFRLLITFLFEYARPCMNIPTRIHKRTKPAITSLDYSVRREKVLVHSG
jgi:hypothetical protein